MKKGRMKRERMRRRGMKMGDRERESENRTGELAQFCDRDQRAKRGIDRKQTVLS
jgi:hypothetical protein